MFKGKRQGIARAACTVGLTTAIAVAGLPLAAVPAWAGTITVSVNDTKSNEGLTYRAYQLFSGTVTEVDGGEALKDAEWASGAEKVFGQVIKQYAGKDGHPDYNGTTARDAADYLEGQLGESDNTTVVDSDSLAGQLAAAMEGGLTPSAEFKAGTASKDLGEGYYLILTKSDDALKGHAAATAPVFALVGKKGLTVNEKASVPTIKKEVKEDSTGEYGRYADAQAGQAIDYRLTATLPKDLANYTTYQLKFVDYLSKGLTYDDKAGFKVKVIHAEEGKEDDDITGSFKMTKVSETSPDADAGDAVYKEGQQAYTFACGDLRDIKLADGTGITKDDKIVLEYSAQFNKDAVVGTPGNPNEAKLVYSNNPHGQGTGTTELVDPVVYTYRLKLLKVDKTDNDKTLAGAKFTIQLTAADDKDGMGSGDKYVQEDGSLSDTKHEFETDKDGTISVAGLDAGTYQIHETVAPVGYDLLTSDPVIKIDSNHGAEGKLAVEVTKSGNSYSEASVEEDGTGGTVKVTMQDAKNVGMPQTGSTGFVALIAGGAALVAASLAALLRRNRPARR